MFIIIVLIFIGLIRIGLSNFVVNRKLEELPELPEGFLITFFFLLLWVRLVLDCPLDGESQNTKNSLMLKDTCKC